MHTFFNAHLFANPTLSNITTKSKHKEPKLYVEGIITYPCVYSIFLVQFCKILVNLLIFLIEFKNSTDGVLNNFSTYVKSS